MPTDDLHSGNLQLSGGSAGAPFSKIGLVSVSTPNKLHRPSATAAVASAYGLSTSTGAAAGRYRAQRKDAVFHGDRSSSGGAAGGANSVSRVAVARAIGIGWARGGRLDGSALRALGRGYGGRWHRLRR
jgi:hypothetical protein